MPNNRTALKCSKLTNGFCAACQAFGSVWDDRHRLLLMQRLRTRFSTAARLQRSSGTGMGTEFGEIKLDADTLVGSLFLGSEVGYDPQDIPDLFCDSASRCPGRTWLSSWK